MAIGSMRTLLAVLLVFGLGARESFAHTLTEVLRGSVQTNAGLTVPDPNGGPDLLDVSQAQLTDINNGVTSVVSNALQRIAIRGIDFPVVATVPGFSYVYNPTLQTFERSTYLGPVFSERAETLGKGRFQVGMSYLYANLDQVNGEDLGVYSASVPAFESLGNGSFFVDNRIDFQQFSLKHHLFNFSLTYGISDRWDANVLMPVIYTKMTVRGQQQFRLSGCNAAGQCQTLGTTFAGAVRADGDALGPGDVLLRTKYRFYDGPANLAAVFTIRLPTGRQADFQGLGDTAITPSIVAAAPLGAGFSVYGNFGVEVNGDDLQRTRARYALGGAYQVIEQVAILLDVIGSSSFVDDEFDVFPSGGAVVVRNLEGRRKVQPNGMDVVLDTSATNVYAIPRSDVVDLAIGTKIAFAPNATAYLGAIVPLTNDGIRADVIPTGGIEFGF